MCVAVCWVMALLHLCIAVLGHHRRANLLVVLMAVGAGAVALSEIINMKATDLANAERTLIISEFFLVALVVPIPWFVQIRFGTGRRWLVVLASLMWLSAITLSIPFPGGQTFSEIISLTPLTTFWGEPFMQIEGIRSPLALLGDLSVLVILIYVADASIRLWRRRDHRRRALMVGGSIILFFVAAMAHVPLVDLGLLQLPYMIGLSFMPIVASMSLEMVQDVVASSRLSRQVAANEARWSTLLDNIHLLVVGLDRGGRLSYVNPHLCQVIGYQPEELLGEHFAPFIAPHDLPVVRKRFAGAIDGTIHEETQSRLRTKTGDDRTIRWSIVLLHDESGSVSGTVSVGTDLTERLRAEQALRETKVTLERAHSLNLLGELSAALAHEINQPLTAILSNAQAARRFMSMENPELDEVRAILDDIIDDDKRAGGVIRRLRTLMRPGPIKIEICDLHRIIHDTLDLCREDLLGIDVDLDLAAEDPLVNAGRVELQQVLMNLVSNARQAMDGCPVRTLGISTTNENGWLLVRVCDTGTGIPNELLSGIFEPFTSTRPEGFGMGLAICRRLLEVHACEIEAKNRPQGGAEFIVKIPTRKIDSE